ncbi:MAG: non-canonical purine NTP diphosphatase [Bacteroidaceae bacterium]|nr:non-canonical purine NTP diphosphatase [Bacteroidaceae bacterium]
MKLVFATNNTHKLSEVRQILGDNFEVVSLEDIGCNTDIPETSSTLEGNALQKARYVKEHFGLDCFADDTGLEVAILDGAPGVFTARYAETEGWGREHDSAANVDCLLHKMENKSDRRARFRTVIALIYNGKEHLFEGIVEGLITTNRQGTDGFGYDPIFQPEGCEGTFAEMGPEAKNAVSHRGRAIRRLAQFLKDKS